MEEGWTPNARQSLKELLNVSSHVSLCSSVCFCASLAPPPPPTGSVADDAGVDGPPGGGARSANRVRGLHEARAAAVPVTGLQGT